MKASILALALLVQVDAIAIRMQNTTANATAEAAAATPSVFTDGPNKNVGYTRDNYIKDAPPQTAKGTGHPDYEGQVYGRSKIINDTYVKPECKDNEFNYGYCTK